MLFKLAASWLNSLRDPHDLHNHTRQTVYPLHPRGCAHSDQERHEESVPAVLCKVELSSCVFHMRVFTSALALGTVCRAIIQRATFFFYIYLVVDGTGFLGLCRTSSRHKMFKHFNNTCKNVLLNFLSLINSILFTRLLLNR